MTEESKEKKKKKENPHEAHRQRLRDKFIKFGLDALEDHEFLELILFYAVPRKNTNLIAHDLISEYGSFKDILEADLDNITRINGLGENSALIFKIIMASIRKYITCVNDISEARLTPHNICIYVKDLFYGQTNETAYVLLLDKDCIVRKMRKLSEGTFNKTPLYPRDIVKIAVNERYPYLIVAHNHPGGSPMPSKSDIYVTKAIEMALSFIDVRLVDHIIVAGEHVVSLSKHFNLIDTSE